ncbi:HET-domain-containing protein, partial [Parathielavia hyrcaniae]
MGPGSHIVCGIIALLLAGTSLTLWATDDTPTNAKGLKSSILYPPLSNSTDSLRLLVLLPGRWYQPIRCELVSTTFSENPQYEALSYAWGAESGRAFRSISVNGARVKVGKNIWHALDHLRSATQSRVLWIDALCINQDDTDEKNEQIPLMLFIYSRARGVLVWLGVHSAPFDLNKRKLEQLDGQDRRELDYIHVDTPYVTRNSGPPDWEKAVRSFLRALVHEGYWKRTWIVQEFIVASKVTVLFGTSVVPWGHFLEWVTYYNQIAPGDTAVEFILKLDRMRQSQFRYTAKFTLASLIDTFQGSLCQLPHDKIYAFRGLAHDHIDDSIPVDYRKPPFEVYKDAVHFQNAASV